MNLWAAAILWGVLQVTLLATFGLVLHAIARRRGPEVGALTSIGTLVAILSISALAVVPLPASWHVSDVISAFQGWVGSPTSVEQSASAESLSAATNQAAIQHRPSTMASVNVAEFWKMFVDEIGPAAVQPNIAERSWPLAVLTIFAIGSMWGVFRFVAGATALRSYRRQSRPIRDTELNRLVQALSSENDCRRHVELRETIRLSTPATLGYFRPLVLLPIDWRDWTSDELRAVLAHEIAHVARGDYVFSLIAQITLSLHFYHPLVHWLVGCLRLEQELAADARGMRATGGREAYLMTLAGMALRQHDLAVSWAARPFLPTRGTFMRRIEMLRDSRKQLHGSLTRGGRALLIGAVVLAALIVAGFRPAGSNELQAQPPSTGANGLATSLTRLSLDHVPAEARVVAAVSPAIILARSDMAELQKVINGQFQPMLGFPVEQLEQVTVAVSMNGDHQPPGYCVVLRSVSPQDWRGLTSRMGDPSRLESVQLGEHKYLRVKDDRHQRCLFVADERTLVIQPETKMKEAIANIGQEKPKWVFADLWARVAGGDVAIAAIPMEGLGMHLDKAPQARHLGMSLAPLWRDTRAIAVGIGMEDRIAVTGYADCKSPEDATRVVRTLEAVRTLFQNTEPEIRKSIAHQPAHLASGTLSILNAVTAITNTAKLTTDENLVELTADGPASLAVTLGILAPSITAAREAAQRAQSINNLKQIALAMYNYESAQKTFPPAIVIGPDGRTPHSWRVALLPYLGHDALYREYRLDEPWDSENNRQVLAKMPAIYRHPSDGGLSTNSSYFVLTGESTVFNGSTGCRLADIRDGTSNTILVVEARRDIPWTRPEDIPFDPDGDLPELGGYHAEGFSAAHADGSVTFYSKSVDATLLRARITKAGGDESGWRAD
jgi:beta-lactamase regulating signal transducer with metallopeptidase domain